LQPPKSDLLFDKAQWLEGFFDRQEDVEHTLPEGMISKIVK